MTTETCENCGKTIGKLEPRFLFKEQVICKKCDEILNGFDEKKFAAWQKQEAINEIQQREERYAPWNIAGVVVIALFVLVIGFMLIGAVGKCNRSLTRDLVSKDEDARVVPQYPTVHYEILRQFRPHQAPNSLGLDLLVGSDISLREIATLIIRLSTGKDPVQIRIYTDRKVYEDSENNIYSGAFDEHFLLFYVKNLTVRGAYYGLNEIRWMQEKGKFRDLFGTKTHLQQ